MNRESRAEQSEDELHGMSSKLSRHGGSFEQWWAVGSALLFLDALGGAVFLPVLTPLVRKLGADSDASVAMWVGLLVATYYASRSGSLLLARFCTRAPTASAPLFHVGLILVLSTLTYLSCGLLVGQFGLLWLTAFRLLSGIIAAGHQTIGIGFLEASARREDGPSSTRSSYRNSGATAIGLFIGCAIAGLFFSQDDKCPIARLCLVVVGVNVLLALLVFFVWQQCSNDRSAHRWSALAKDISQPSFNGRKTSGETVESEIEVELSSGTDNKLSNNGYKGGIEREAVKVAASVPAPAAPGDVSDKSPRREVKVPQRYLRGCKEDQVEAERRWRLTLEWRARERIDEILQEPQPHFDIIKRYYPHYIHRRARNGCPIWIELPTRINLPAIRSSGVSDEALQRHYVFVTEYLWGVVEPNFDTGQAITVLDVQGLGMRDFAGDALGFVKRATSIVQDHYVERSNRMFIINAPSYFSMIWRIIRPMLNERTQAKISIVGADKAKVKAALLEAIAPEDLPQQYGGTCDSDLGESEEERGLREYVARVTPSLRLDDNDEEVKVNLHTGDVELSPRESVPKLGTTTTAKTAPEMVEEFSKESLEKDRIVSKMGEQESSVTRNVFSQVAGAVGWASGKLSWRRPNVAHLGDENAFVYDEKQQRWVLGDVTSMGSEHRKSIGAESLLADGGADENRRRDERFRSQRPRKNSIGSNSSEEMTVLAIQAAHFSSNGGGKNISPLPSNPSPIPSTGGGGRINHSLGKFKSAGSPELTGDDPELGAGSTIVELSQPSGRGGNGLVISYTCMRFCRHRPAELSFGAIVYAASTAVREAIPVWALTGADAGGLGATSGAFGGSIAAGVLLGEAGRAVASAGWLGTRFSRESGDISGHHVLCAVRGRLAVVPLLGAVYLVARIIPAALPKVIVWVAVVAVVASNQLVLGLSRDERAKNLSPGTTCTSLVVGDTLGSATGPLSLALGFRSGWPPPFGASLWFVFIICLDLWLLMGAQPVGMQHSQLVDIEDGDDVVSERDKADLSATRSAQFV